MTAKIVSASKKDVRLMTPKLRLTDAQLATLGSVDPMTLIEDAIDRADQCWVGRVDGDIVCVWGIQGKTLLSDEVYLWLVTTDLVEKHQFKFLRYSQDFIKELSTRYRRVWGLVDAEYDTSIRWLKWLGFTIKGFSANSQLREFEKVSRNG